MCRLADLFNPFENVFAFPFVYRHPEGLPAVRGLDDRNRQIAADVCLRFWFLRRLQDLENLLGVSGRLEARKKQVYVGFIREEHLARSLILQSGFEGMEASSLDLERIRHELVLVQGVSHLWVGELNEDAVLDGHFDHLPLPIVAARAGDARSVFLDGHLQPKDDCGLVLIEHGHAPPTVDDQALPAPQGFGCLIVLALERKRHRLFAHLLVVRQRLSDSGQERLALIGFQRLVNRDQGFVEIAEAFGDAGRELLFFGLPLRPSHSARSTRFGGE